MELEDIVYELACLHESMLFCCENRSGKEDPVFALLAPGDFSR